MRSTKSFWLPGRLLAGCLLLSLPACGGSPEPVAVSLKCAPMPVDIGAEARRGPVIKGETGVEVAGHLVNQVHKKNRAIARAVKNFEACRAS